MKLKSHFIYIPMFIIVLSCGKTDREEKLEAREKLVEQKELRLDTLDQQLQLKEQLLSRRELKFDSLKSQTDNPGVLNLQLVGNWHVSMQCTEATCEGYAVGDTKTEQWNISYDKDKVIVKAISNKKVVRIYSGLFKDNSLKMTAVPQPDPETTMNIVLSANPSNEKLMEGQRVIQRGNNCKVVFAVQLEKL